VRGVVAALAFFTRIPTGGHASADDLPAALPWLPAIGLVLGAVGVGLDTALGPERRVTAWAVVLLWALLCGGVHLEGLADVCDALGSSRRGEEAYRIMKDPHVGVYGVVGVMFVVLGQIEAVSALAATPTHRVGALLCAPLIARVVPAAALKLLPPPAYVHEGLAYHARRADGRVIAIAGAAAVAFALVAGEFAPTLVALAAGAMVVYAVTRPLGGLTGDVCGAAVEITSLVYLATAALVA